jgi:hypothetical protein
MTAASARWRVLYRIDESKHAVIVQDIQHRSTAYRRRQARAIPRRARRHGSVRLAVTSPRDEGVGPVASK